jgi:hypothetical protein
MHLPHRGALHGVQHAERLGAHQPSGMHKGRGLQPLRCSQHAGVGAEVGGAVGEVRMLDHARPAAQAGDPPAPRQQAPRDGLADAGTGAGDHGVGRIGTGHAGIS